MVKIAELARFIRSTIAAPPVVTLDIIFKDKDGYMRVKNSTLINKETISKLYSVQPDRILGIFFMDNAWAIKISIMSPHVSGDPEWSDHWMNQQHAPLHNIDVP